MDYTLFGGFPELLNADCLPPSFKLDQADGELLREPHPFFSSYTMNLSLKLIHNASASAILQVAASISASDSQT
jgi:hypothetical protein